MPCRDGGPTDNEIAYDYKRRLDLATRVACEAMSVLTKGGNYTNMSAEAKTWWQKHQDEDARRIAREKAERKRLADKKAALAKLTPAEKKALNL
jgi:hypothetical protein